MTDNSVSIDGNIHASDLRRLAQHGPIGKLSLTKMPRLTARAAQGFGSLPSVEEVWLWCDVTRTAMRHVVSIPGLRVLDVLAIVKPGRLQGFSDALSLEVVRANHYMSADDLLEICTCRTLRELGAQGAELSPEAIAALLALPRLTILDLEGCEFDDAMAEQISVSISITSLDLGATRLSSIGLMHICKMKQLRSIDLWATGIAEADLAPLTALPLLEAISLGGYDHLPSLNAELILILLSQLPSLKRIWLDGIDLQPSQRAELAARYEHVCIT